MARLHLSQLAVAPHPIEHCHGLSQTSVWGKRNYATIRGRRGLPRGRFLPGSVRSVLYLRRIEGLRGIRHSAAPHPPSIGHACAGPRPAFAVTVHQGGPRQPASAVAERAAKPPFTGRRSHRSDPRSQRVARPGTGRRRHRRARRGLAAGAGLGRLRHRQRRACGRSAPAASRPRSSRRRSRSGSGS